MRCDKFRIWDESTFFLFVRVNGLQNRDHLRHAQGSKGGPLLMDLGIHE